MLGRIWRDWLIIFLVLVGSLLSLSFNITTFLTANQPVEHSPSDVTSDCIKTSANSFVNSPYFEPYNIFWGGNSFDTGYDIALDNDNNILVSGINYASGLILIKFTSNGTYLWNTTIGPSGSNIGYALVIDSTGFIYVAGIARTFSDYAYLWKFSPEGNILWNYTITGPRYLYAFDLSFDSNENIIIIGYTFDELPSHQIFIYKITSEGNLLWNITWGGILDERPYGLVIDSDDNIYLTGYMDSTVIPMADIFVLKFSSEGGLIWNQTIAWEEYDQAYTLCLDVSEKYLYVVGETSSYGVGLWDSLICKLKSRTGELIWFQTFGEELFDIAYDVFLDKDENVIVVGDTESSSNGWDIFICQYSPKTGELFSNYTWGEDENDRCKSGIYFFDGMKEALYLVGETGSFGILYSDLLLLLFIDSDGDKLTDKWELDNLTDPLNTDSDQDGLDDYQELAIYNTDPLNPDSDLDGWFDGKEVIWGTDPLNPNSTPARRKAILFPCLSFGLLLITGSTFFVIIKKKRNETQNSIE